MVGAKRIRVLVRGTDRADVLRKKEIEISKINKQAKHKEENVKLEIDLQGEDSADEEYTTH